MAVFDKKEDNIVITGTEEADSIKNSGSNVTVDADDGKDTIDNSGNGVVINAGHGVDSISNGGSQVSVSGGDSGDYINNTGSNSTLNGDGGNDSINNQAQYVTVFGGAGNDSVTNTGSFTSMDMGSDDDTVDNSASNVTVLGGAGNDLIKNHELCDSAIISGGDGDDTIRNHCWYESFDDSNITLDGGAGNDYIENGGKGVTMLGGAGDDSIENYGEGSVKIDSGNGDDTIENNAPNCTVEGGAGNDTIQNNDRNGSINGGADNDYLYNSGYGSLSALDGGDGADTVNNEASNVTIGGGAGNDYIKNNGAEASIDGGADNDTISSNGNDATISGGSGNDSIKSTGNSVLFKYAVGDGDDTIEGFNEGSRLRIGDGKTDTYAILKSGNDVIVYVGDGSILLTGAAALDELSIAGVENELPIWRINGTTATYGTSTETQIIVNGVKSVDGITRRGNVITVAESALGTDKVTINDGYILALKSDVTAPSTTAEGWNLSGSTATYKTASTSAGYSVVNNQIVYTPNSGGETLVTVNGVKSTGGLTADTTNKKVTVSDASLNQGAVTISNGYTLVLGNDVTQTSTTAANWSINGTTATYKNAYTSAGYKLENNQISYVKASGGETLATVTGVKSLDGIAIDTTNKKITVSNAALNLGTVKVSNGYTLALGNDVTQTSTTAADWDLNGTTATYKNAYTSAGYSLANNQISYVGASGGNTLTTVSGVKSLDGISLSGTTVTVSKAALNQEAVSVSSGYHLALGNDVTQSNSTAAGWTKDGSNATYKTAYTSAGYKLENNQINYLKESGGESLATVKGIKSTSGLSLKDKVVTVSNAALNQKTVTVNEGYKLKLASDVTKTSSTKAWSYKSNKATYKQTTKAGYTLADNVINYTKASTKNLAKVSGVKSKDGLKVSGTTITVSNAALNQKKVTVSGDYNLKLGSDVTKPSNKKAAWSYSKGTAIYKSAYSTAGYKLDDGEILYSKATTAKGLATIKGAGSKSGLTVSGDKITLKKSALSKKVTVSGNYEFDFDSAYKKATITGSKSDDIIITRGDNLSVNGGNGDDTIKALGNNSSIFGGDGKDVFVYKSGKTVISDYAEEDKINVTSGTVKASASGRDVIFTVGKGKITISGGKGKTISYVDKKGPNTYSAESDFSIKGAAITLLKNYAENKFNVAEYGSKLQTINAAAVTRDLTITANDNANSILGGKGNDTLIGGKGNDTLKGGAGADVFVYASGDGNDVITDYKAEDKIKITSGTPTLSTSNKDVIVKVGSGKITVKNGKDKVVTYINKAGKELCYSNTVVLSNKGKTATLSGKYPSGTFVAEEYGSAIRTIDASKVSKKLSITGSAFADSITGGAGDDTLIGGHGNDTLKGGDGKDVFVYNSGDGNDVISDYAKGDTIKLMSGSLADAVTVKSSDVIFTVNNSGTITVKKGKGQKITFVDKDGNTIRNQVYTKSTMQTESLWFTVDDTNFDTDNQLGSIVKDSSAAYSFDVPTESTSLMPKDTLITYTDSK